MPAEKPIWLYGKARFMRETMAQVLTETFGANLVCEVSEGEPTLLTLPKHACWVIWLLNGIYESGAASTRIMAPESPLNFVFIESDGRALVHRTNRGRLERPDISLAELISILKTTLDECAKSPKA